MLRYDFDFTGRLIAVRFSKKGVDNQNFTATGKYFITLAKTIKTRNGYGTLYHDFTMWNSKNSQYQAVKGFTTHVGIGDVAEVAGDFTPETKGQDGTWYASEDNVLSYRRIARSFKHQEQANERFAQKGTTNMFGNPNGNQANNGNRVNTSANTQNPNKASNNRPVNHANMNGNKLSPKNTGKKLTGAKKGKVDISDDDLPF